MNLTLYDWMLLSVAVVPYLAFVLAFAAIWRFSHRQHVATRVRALNEAAACLASMASTAESARDDAVARRDFLSARAAANRQYFYDRAASIVRSIPEDRLW
jgi:hypothetical protein